MRKSRIASSIAVLLTIYLYTALVCAYKTPLCSTDWILLGGVVAMLVLLGLCLLTSECGNVNVIFRPLQIGICLGFTILKMAVNSILLCLPKMTVRSVAIYESIFFLLFYLLYAFVFSAKAKAAQQETYDIERIAKIRLLENELRTMAQRADISVRKSLEQLADTAHGCDAFTHPQLEQLDERIEQSISQLHLLLEDNQDQEAFAEETHILATLLSERNRMAALLRQSTYSG